MKQMIRYILLAILLAQITDGHAQRTSESPIPSDSIQFSLLTCGPGEEIYSLFGHTAIRYQDFRKGTDVVFNYGLFNFHTPNFVLRFALGETDYLLGMETYEQFRSAYELDNRSVLQQPLNFTTEEKLKLLELLEINYRPENQTYRYNYFYDNCATRPRDLIENAIRSSEYLHYFPFGDGSSGQTYRSIVHQFTEGHPWARFGMDLCLGSEADRPITNRQTMFAPFYLMNHFQKAAIQLGDSIRPLTDQITPLVTSAPEDKDDENNIDLCPTPLQSSLALLALTLGASIYGLKRQRTLWGVDALLFTAAGLAGCVLAFLALFSQHPTVGSNFLLLLFHPLHLIAVPFLIMAGIRKKRSYYHLLIFIEIDLLILFFWLIPQKFDITILPLALCLQIRSMSNLLLTYKRKE